MDKIKLHTKISKLDLTGQINSTIPFNVFELENLKKLTLSNCGLKHLPLELSKLKRLELLDVSNNEISNLYAKIFELKNLKVLILNNNKLTSLPKQISKLKNLKILGIANNRLSSFPDTLTKLDNLEELNFSKNDFSYFPQEILDLKSLKRMWIGGNSFSNLPIDKIKSIPNLQALYCFSSALNIKNNLIDEFYLKLSKIRGNSFYTIKKLSFSNKKEIRQMQKTSKKVKIFISYSHEDSYWLALVKKHLKVLKFENNIFDDWDDTRIKTGSKWKEEITKSLDECKIAILLISTDFLASDFINNDELPPLLKSAESNGTKILPLIISPSRFLKNKSLNIFQAANNPSQPLSDLSKSEQDKVLLKLVDDIEFELNQK
jgi:hypothetical protein